MTEGSDSSRHAKVVVVPGVPAHSKRLDSGQGLYPSTTIDIVKLLREAGLTVEYQEQREDRRTLGLKSIDIWIPILLFSRDIAWDVAVSYVSDAIHQLFDQRQLSRATLKVEVGREDRKGEAVWFKGEGKADDVIRAMREADL